MTDNFNLHSNLHSNSTVTAQTHHNNTTSTSHNSCPMNINDDSLMDIDHLDHLDHLDHDSHTSAFEHQYHKQQLYPPQHQNHQSYQSYQNQNQHLHQSDFQTSTCTQMDESNSNSNSNDMDIMDIMDIDRPPPPPLIVMDGANIAYTYSSSLSKSEPDVDGIDIAVQYFLQRGLRVLVVLPAQWMRKKPSLGDLLQENAMMQTSQLDTLTRLKSQGLLCLSPPTDDDDAYIIDIARKADSTMEKHSHIHSHTHTHTHSHTNNNNTDRNSNSSNSNNSTCIGGAYILSCDLYRDAIHRDRMMRRHQQHHQNYQTNQTNTIQGGNNHNQALGEWIKRKRISFTFYNNDTHNHGHSNIDQAIFVPNPRHELISILE